MPTGIPNSECSEEGNFVQFKTAQIWYILAMRTAQLWNSSTVLLLHYVTAQLWYSITVRQPSRNEAVQLDSSTLLCPACSELVCAILLWEMPSVFWLCLGKGNLRSLMKKKVHHSPSQRRVDLLGWPKSSMALVVFSVFNFIQNNVIKLYCDSCHNSVHF